MPVQHSTPARQTRSQARAQVVLTPTPRAPLDGTPEVPQMRAHLDRGPNLKEKNHPRRRVEGQEDQVPFQELLAVLQYFQGPLSKVLVKMVKRRRSILWKKKSLMVLKVFLLLWGPPVRFDYETISKNY
ncbi:hypothetical protein O181_133260 [Austropuccinia psidii MF-1]|uniref:Uncharacterized protein n=1 Tax=Austropuccinia psidii MF-1 TaxID=1389203 RepID=A0A9Q3L7Y2_9BASI|nr:hypothetical protein [Austropuccinia psidii MF-1]